MRKVYLDYAGTTPVYPEVADLMYTYLTREWGNPSSRHGMGTRAKEGLDKAREQVAAFLGAEPEEIVFTSSGTEADNLAVFGTALAAGSEKRHIITSSIEHHAVLDACRALEAEGFEVTYLRASAEGIVSPDEVGDSITESTCLVSLMYVNNEVGTIQPVEEVGRIVKSRGGILFHVDAVQAAGKLPLDVNRIHCDLLSVSAHKIYGPKGAGCLYVRKGVELRPMLVGGGQEGGLRAGTENVPAIAGFGLACELVSKQREDENRRLGLLRDKLIDGVLKTIPDSVLNGSRNQRISCNANFSFRGISGDALLAALNLRGIYASAGSACSAGLSAPSHVLLAMGLPAELAGGSLRMTLGRLTSTEDIDYVLEVLPEVVSRLREIAT